MREQLNSLGVSVYGACNFSGFMRWLTTFRLCVSLRMKGRLVPVKRSRGLGVARHAVTLLVAAEPQDLQYCYTAQLSLFHQFGERQAATTQVHTSIGRVGPGTRLFCERSSIRGDCMQCADLLSAFLTYPTRVEWARSLLQGYLAHKKRRPPRTPK